MIGLIFYSMLNELEKIANEADSSGSENTNSDVEEAEASPAAKQIFAQSERVRITQPKDPQTGEPMAKAKGSPVKTKEEAARESYQLGREEATAVTARKGVEEAAKAAKKAYESGYSNAAQQGIRIAAGLYLQGRDQNPAA